MGKSRLAGWRRMVAVAEAIRWHIPLSFLVTLALCATWAGCSHQKHWQHRKFICCLVDYARRILYFD